jgi:hypothetical protein
MILHKSKYVSSTLLLLASMCMSIGAEHTYVPAPSIGSYDTWGTCSRVYIQSPYTKVIDCSNGCDPAKLRGEEATRTQYEFFHMTCEGKEQSNNSTGRKLQGGAGIMAWIEEQVEAEIAEVAKEALAEEELAAREAAAVANQEVGTSRAVTVVMNQEAEAEAVVAGGVRATQYTQNLDRGMDSKFLRYSLNPGKGVLREDVLLRITEEEEFRVAAKKDILKLRSDFLRVVPWGKHGLSLGHIQGIADLLLELANEGVAVKNSELIKSLRLALANPNSAALSAKAKAAFIWANEWAPLGVQDLPEVMSKELVREEKRFASVLKTIQTKDGGVSLEDFDFNNNRKLLGLSLKETPIVTSSLPPSPRPPPSVSLPEDLNVNIVSVRVTITSFTDAIKKVFSDGIERFTGTPPQRLKIPGLVDNAPRACGYVEVALENLESSDGVYRSSPMYAYDECPSSPVDTILSASAHLRMMELTENGPKMIPTSNEYMDDFIRLGDPITARKYKNMVRFYHPLEKMWVAVPYKSYGLGGLRYSPNANATYNLAFEAYQFHVRSEYMLNRLYPGRESTYTGAFGPFSSTTMTMMQSASTLVKTVLGAAAQGEYIPVENEFKPSTIRPIKVTCAAIGSYMLWKKTGQTNHGKFDDKHNYCKHVNVDNVVTLGLPSASSRLSSGFQMFQLISNATHALNEDFIKIKNPSVEDHNWLAYFSLMNLDSYFRVLDHIWISGADLQSTSV